MNSRIPVSASLLSILPFLVWWYYLLHYSVNIPWLDDLDPFSDFIRQWRAVPEATARLELLFRPNNEHRMIFGKLSALLSYLLTGQLNITFLHVAGAFFWCGILWILWKVFRLLGAPSLYFLPVPFLMFQMKTHLIFLWAVCGLQHQPVLFFVCLSLFLLARRQFYPALLAALCATFSMANGMLVWIAGAGVLLYRAQWKHLPIWVITASIAIFLYFHDMTTQGNEAGLAYFLNHPHLSFLGFVAFMGSMFDLLPINQPITWRTALPAITGIVTVGLSIYWLLAQYLPWLKKTAGSPLRLPAVFRAPQQHSDRVPVVRDFLLGLLIFLLVNGLIIGLLRPRFGFFVVLLSNYKPYSVMFLAAVYLMLLIPATARQRVRTFRLGACAAVLIWAFSVWYETPVINERRKSLLVAAYNQEHNGFGLGFSPETWAAKYLDTLMRDLTREGIYHYPDTYQAAFKQMRTQAGSGAPIPDLQVEQGAETLTVTQMNKPPGFSFDDCSYVFVRNQERLYVFQMVQTGYHGRNPFRQYERTRAVQIPYHYLVPGSYEVGVYMQENDAVQQELLREVVIPPRSLQ